MLEERFGEDLADTEFKGKRRDGRVVVAVVDQQCPPLFLEEFSSHAPKEQAVTQERGVCRFGEFTLGTCFRGT